MAPRARGRPHATSARQVAAVAVGGGRRVADISGGGAAATKHATHELGLRLLAPRAHPAASILR